MKDYLSAVTRKSTSVFRSIHLGSFLIVVAYLIYVFVGGPLPGDLPEDSPWAPIFLGFHIYCGVLTFGLFTMMIGAILKWFFGLFGIDPNDWFLTWHDSDG